ncbi:MAG: hypothetical protein EXX96DRAFT_611074 [Benjaminiella poitrasii]|nr:MAG: hypothetical protein EXX96DRAFT_611074 [Benjaminiella poitrasii]
MEPTSIEQRLDESNRLPEGFFPEPQLSPSHLQVTGSHKASKPKHRVIVIAYDHSNYGDAMIAKIIRLGFIKPTDDIRLLNIVNQTDYRTLFGPMLTAQNTSSIRDIDPNDTTVKQVADAMLWEVITALRKIGFENVSSEILRGDPKDSITDYCRMVKPVYLITGTRGFGAVKRTVLGSVSNYLTKHCPCPVMVIKLEPGEIEARKELNEQKKASFVEVMEAYNSSHPQK